MLLKDPILVLCSTTSRPMEVSRYLKLPWSFCEKERRQRGLKVVGYIKRERGEKKGREGGERGRDKERERKGEKGREGGYKEPPHTAETSRK